MKLERTILFGAAALMLALSAGCSGPAGPAGAKGTDGVDGQNGVDGQSGTDGQNGTDGANGNDGADGKDGADGNDGADGESGTDGKNGGNVGITELHGEEYLLSTGEYANGAKTFVTIEITGATADASGKATVDFKVKDDNGDPVVGASPNFNIVALAPAAGKEGYNKWVPYIYRTETVGKDGFPKPKGTTAKQAYNEKDGTLTDNGDGSYSYQLKVDLSKVDGVTYDRSLVHRIAVRMGGHSGPTAESVYDFVPDGSNNTASRDIVPTESCHQCHGEKEFNGHGGDRLTVQGCVTCHAPGSSDAHSGETIDFKVMIHKIHAGEHLPGSHGPDGILWDDPNTSQDEQADNDTYKIYGYKDNKHTWWNVAFPAVIENCTKCHQGSGKDKDNWKTVYSKAACQSCHSDVDVAAGTNHAGGPQDDDKGCKNCHNDGIAPSVEKAHDWTKHDPRNIPEFTVDLKVSQPANTTHFVAGEQPEVTIVIKENGQAIDHTKIFQEDTPEGCKETDNVCPPRDSKFQSAKLLVHGPRARAMPVLTNAAHAKLASKSTGPFNMVGKSSMDFVFDGGQDLMNGEAVIAAKVSVSTASLGATETPATLAAWLDADSKFKARGIAWVEGGLLYVRSRALGTTVSLQVADNTANTEVFANTSVKLPSGYYTYVDFVKHNDPAKDDPRVQWSQGSVKYLLDKVDDLKPGTYVASVEISDGGRKSATDYRTPAVAITPFQVGTKTEELPVARGCDSCHWSNVTDTGFVLDYGRHNKLFKDLAMDQCTGCHDYQPMGATGPWSGGKPIARRVHAVHMGANLNYPNTTVGYNDYDNRNWQINFPQDIRNCEACHGANTSGSWKTESARVPCGGCHDADAAQVHMKLMTWDPTPDNPWSGDEQESCQACH